MVEYLLEFSDFSQMATSYCWWDDIFLKWEKREGKMLVNFLQWNLFEIFNISLRKKNFTKFPYCNFDKNISKSISNHRRIIFSFSFDYFSPTIIAYTNFSTLSGKTENHFCIQLKVDGRKVFLERFFYEK